MRQRHSLATFWTLTTETERTGRNYRPFWKLQTPNKPRCYSGIESLSSSGWEDSFIWISLESNRRSLRMKKISEKMTRYSTWFRNRHLCLHPFLGTSSQTAQFAQVVTRTITTPITEAASIGKHRRALKRVFLLSSHQDSWTASQDGKLKALPSCNQLATVSSFSVSTSSRSASS